MKVLNSVLRAVGPVVVGASLLALPLLFAPEPVQASSSGDCAGWDTVECSTTEWCIGFKWFGFGLCHTSHNYWPPVTVITDPVGDWSDYYHTDDGFGGGGGGSF